MASHGGVLLVGKQDIVLIIFYRGGVTSQDCFLVAGEQDIVPDMFYCGWGEGGGGGYVEG